MPGITGTDTSLLNRNLTVSLQRYSSQISNELARNDGVVAIFGQRNRIKVTGGRRAVETLDVAENPNFAARSPYTNIPTAKGDPRKEAIYDWATLDGSVTLADFDKNMNAGSTKIHDLLAADVDNAKNTIVRQFADLLRKASPTSVDPESIVSIVENNAKASQSNATGGISRSANTWWRNEYSNATMDLSGANLEVLFAFIEQEVSKGATKMDQPDFGLTSGTIFAALMYQAHQYTRWTPDADAVKMGVKHVVVDGVTIIPDPSIVAGDLYLLNTNFMQIQVLKSDNMKDVGKRPQTIPISIRPFMDAYNSRHSASVMYVDFALTTSSLQRQGIATNCS